MTESSTNSVEPAGGTAGEESGGAVYWFYRNTLKGIRRRYEANRRGVILTGCMILVLLFLFRASFHHYIIVLRRSLLLIAILVPLWLWTYRKIRTVHFGPKVALMLVATLLTAGLLTVGRVAHGYVALALRFSSLDLVDLTELPLTGNERIQPLNSVFSLAHEIMTEGETPMMPDFVRIGDDYRWTLAIEPAYPLSRLLEGVGEIYNVSATASSPNFGRENRQKVTFEVGEHLLFGRRSAVATIRSFNPWKFLNYEPTDVTYLKDDSGDWVQVISLVRWRGIFFPQPEFGGVQIVRQHDGGFLATLALLFLGAGEWIPPEQIKDHPFLAGQNVLPVIVSRNIANSFRFQGGFFAPLPGYHKDDIRIPDMAEDVNDQPFPGYFEIPQAGRGALYHYFGLEPFDPTKQGLNTSLFVPADGTAKVYMFRHHDRSGSLTGVSAISAKVMESRKNYDWTRNRPVEHRPFIRQIGGRMRFFWLTTVVTLKHDDKRKEFIAGSIPDVVLTDATYNTPVWVDSLDQSSWIPQIERELSPLWATK